MNARPLNDPTFTAEVVEKLNHGHSNEDPFVSGFVKMLPGAGRTVPVQHPAPVARYTDPSQGMGSQVVEQPEDPLVTMIAKMAGAPYADSAVYYWTGAE
ncbi:hypothetical protein [Amycolatopsis thermophila]|uniref:Uncharacterized protein n=1 Tax=Amycolatopsis thermophila TaxID=206084 RepID=A0ABU0F4D9_9PSEU|nr:hypothetical protein [Amycolatopsis thermophila]MDQ0382442.1 hypothetical protein [Amycolatopsis thermophila]